MSKKVSNEQNLGAHIFLGIVIISIAALSSYAYEHNKLLSVTLMVASVLGMYFLIRDVYKEGIIHGRMTAGKGKKNAESGKLRKWGGNPDDIYLLRKPNEQQNLRLVVNNARRS